MFAPDVVKGIDGRYYLYYGLEDCEDEPNQYIANMRDGAIAGYKYFQFAGNCMLTVRVRGCGSGKFLIMTEEDGDVWGEIMIDLCEESWTQFSSEVSLPSNVSALYFRYLGDGTIDFQRFCMS